MTGALPQLSELGQAWLWHGFVTFLRVGAILSLLPAFGEHAVPARVKLILAFCFTLIVTPAIPATTPADAPGLLRLVLAEAGTGLSIGIGIRLFVLALQTAGSMAAQATSLAQVFGGAGVEPLPAIGHVLVVSGLALAVMSGLHVRAAELMIRSYDMFPAGRFPDAGMIAQWGVARTAQMFALAFTLAAPFVIMSVLYNLTLGVINRAMPQLMVAFVGAPVITAGGLFLLFLLAPILLSRWNEVFLHFLANPFGATP